MSIDSDYQVLRDVLKRKPEGWAAEFGVYSGYSAELISRQMPVIGFDSFQGLPEDWREGFPKGAFSDFSMPDFPDGRVMLVRGWFEDTVPTFPFPKLGLVHIDCDLYSSTVTALEAVAGRIGPGTYVVFDEFHGYPGADQHEQKAWNEFCDQYVVIAETVAFGPEERAFVIESIGSRRA